MEKDALKKYLKASNSKNLDEFIKLSDSSKREIIENKRKHFEKTVEELKQQSSNRVVWRTFSKLTGSKIKCKGSSVINEEVE